MRGNRLSAAIVVIGFAMLQLTGCIEPTTTPTSANSQYTVYVRYPGPSSPAKPVAQRVIANLTALGFDARENVGEESALLWEEVRVDHAVGHRAMGETIRDVVQRTLTEEQYRTTKVVVRQDEDRKSRIIWVLF